jgi:hypothetical protein
MLAASRVADTSSSQILVNVAELVSLVDWRHPLYFVSLFHSVVTIGDEHACLKGG